MKPPILTLMDEFCDPAKADAVVKTVIHWTQSAAPRLVTNPSDAVRLLSNLEQVRVEQGSDVPFDTIMSIFEDRFCDQTNQIVGAYSAAVREESSVRYLMFTTGAGPNGVPYYGDALFPGCCVVVDPCVIVTRFSVVWTFGSNDQPVSARRFRSLMFVAFDSNPDRKG